MKKIITTLFLGAIAIPGFCQLTLTQSNMPAPPATVSIQDMSSQVTTGPSMGSSQTWDYSSLTAGTATGNTFVLGGDANFPSAQFYTTQNLKNLTSALGYYFNAYYDITANGAEMVGIYVPAQNYGIGALTGTATDTLYVLANTITFASPRGIINFPATANSSWASSVRSVVNMTINSPGSGLSNTPMEHEFYWDRSDTIIGWGTLILPPQSGYHNSVSALQDQIVQFCQDSFYLGGSPAPSAITTAFGVVQGQKSGPSYNRISFYSAENFNYQMMFAYDTTFTNVLAVYMNTALPAQGAGINEVSAADWSSACPNPMNGHSFDIHMSADAVVSAVSIMDLSGREVDHINVSNNAGTVRVQTDHTLSDGIYIYSVTGNDGSLLAKGRITAIN